MGAADARAPSAAASSAAGSAASSGQSAGSSSDKPSDFAAELSAVALASKANEVAAFHAAARGIGQGLQVAGGGNGPASDQPRGQTRDPAGVGAPGPVGARGAAGGDVFASAEPAWNALSAYDIVLGLAGPGGDANGA